MCIWHGNAIFFEVSRYYEWSDYIPRWWTAYSKLKHTNAVLNDHATLENVIAAVGAVFVVLNKVYGPGVVEGCLIGPDNIIYDPPVSRVFLTVC